MKTKRSQTNKRKSGGESNRREGDKGHERSNRQGEIMSSMLFMLFIHSYIIKEIHWSPQPHRRQKEGKRKKYDKLTYSNIS